MRHKLNFWKLSLIVVLILSTTITSEAKTKDKYNNKRTFSLTQDKDNDDNDNTGDDYDKHETDGSKLIDFNDKDKDQLTTKDDDDNKYTLPDESEYPSIGYPDTGYGYHSTNSNWMSSSSDGGYHSTDPVYGNNNDNDNNNNNNPYNSDNTYNTNTTNNNNANYNQSNNVSNGNGVYTTYPSPPNHSGSSYGRPSPPMVYTPSYARYYQLYRNPAFYQYLKQMYGQYNYNYRQPATGPYNRFNYTTYNLSPPNNQQQQYLNVSALRSPYQSIPGTYTQSSYSQKQFQPGKLYSYNQIYANYLSTGAFMYSSGACSTSYGQTPKITQLDMEQAFDYAHRQLRDYDRQFGNYSQFSNQSPPLKLKEKEALLMEYVTEYFAKFKCLSKYQTTIFLPSVTIGQQYFRNKYGDTSCYSAYGGQGWNLQCPEFNSKYRTIDGSCNNARHPYWGKSYVCHLRLLPPDYADGVSAPRLANDGSQLPSPRTLINLMTSDKPFESFYTNMKMAFGQFVNHDVTHTPVYFSYALSGSYTAPTDCCRRPNLRQCLPIQIDPTPYDYQYRMFNNTCLNFVRSAPCPLCEIGPRQQSNIVSSFIDASSVYGNTANESAPIRTYKFGLLKTSRDRYGKPILPTTPAPWNNECSPPKASMQCFYAGDQRCNQHPALMSMHLILVRRHNQISTSLHVVNPHWSDEVLFQEARRLVVAELQHITYNEYLRLVFGQTLMDYYGLNVETQGYSRYDPNTDPTSWNEYATAACRFGHSQIRSYHTMFNTGAGGVGPNGPTQGYHLKDSYMDPSFMHEGQSDALINGLLNDLSYSVDPYYSDDITNYLMRKKGDLFGSDLISRNIARGRDHGLASYVNYLKFCFNFDVSSWDDLKLFIPEKYVNLFRQLYKSPKDIDLYIAGITERHFPDADVGPTFACILGIQFHHLKYGDRYYYEHGGQSGSFTLAQLNNIRQTASLARLVCLTSDYISRVQPYSFFPESKYNPKIDCKKYRDFDYQLWKE